ncbi:MAG: hypothetical protein COB17_04210 [Sulfurimonas sp.]|nr:MAG: hypothetical protein COB17_04210 [Sulfurimonas sp.]
MTKIEAPSLEQSYKDAATALDCSITELNIEVVQVASSGFLGFFKKNAIIIAAKKHVEYEVTKTETKPKIIVKKEVISSEKVEVKKVKKDKKINKIPKEQEIEHKILNDTFMPKSFVSTQDEAPGFNASKDLLDIADEVEKDINMLFDLICFDIDLAEVSVYDESTLLVEFKGKDAALLIGKEGYRYKALSYMIFNWINTKYQLQLRLEIAEFLKNQEESIARYLTGVYESVNRDGRCQTKILDGVLIQIALRELRLKYADKYVAIRSTRDGLKYIIINDYHSN